MERKERLQSAVGMGVLVVSALLAWGAWGIPSDAGYAGVGPNFLPWLVTILLALCGSFLVYEARTGGYRQMEEDESADDSPPDWLSFAWLSAGILSNAALISHVGFILSCSLCFVLAAQGLRRSRQEPKGLANILSDWGIGLGISAPVYWMFTKFLGISLPGLSTSGWI